MAVTPVLTRVPSITGHLSDPHSLDIGDGVPRARGEDPHLDPKVPSPGAVDLLTRSIRREKEQRECRD